jgi:transglutaminase-like putative cysteine protease
MAQNKSAFRERRPSMNLRIHHRSTYRYSEEVSFGPHQLRVRPREGHGLRLEKCQVDIAPSGHRIRWMRDPYENNVGIVEFTEPASELVIACEFDVRACDENPFSFVISREAAEFPFYYDPSLYQELLPLVRILYPRDESHVRAWLNPFWRPGRRIGTLELLQLINGRIYEDFRYQRREEKGVQTPAETLEKKSGSCRDFAALFIEACRCLDLAARFVSGYMYSSDISGRMSMHAWAEVYLPGAGWIGFDPSWGILAAAQYIPVAVSRHPENATPISGTFISKPGAFLECEVEIYVKVLQSLDLQRETA